jgi:hypothetical protein
VIKMDSSVILEYAAILEYATDTTRRENLRETFENRRIFWLLGINLRSNVILEGCVYFAWNIGFTFPPTADSVPTRRQMGYISLALALQSKLSALVFMWKLKELIYLWPPFV